ncbi:hypothetical protein IR083_20765 [Dysgonomonas sp. GY75]|uniref:hypothetical protein n=1 Tax=Dysgonomonas sp. GY75 TaxID=2780419 RepID=UPI001883971B|nr:hypothetical protein [Dysgonomonas sp. GY75]MBF0651254.1 hypothetical protein [Dysgonomonas sp. GY75]
MKATLKQIKEEIGYINPSVTTISSLGDMVTAQAQQMADSVIASIMPYIPVDSTAYKVLISNTGDRFSDKQLWVIAYQLEKSSEYCEKLGAEIEERNKYIAFQKAKKTAKSAAKRAAKKSTKESADLAQKVYSSIEAEDKVRHYNFGEGKVISHDDTYIVVFFEKVGEKKLLKKFAKLEKI